MRALLMAACIAAPMAAAAENQRDGLDTLRELLKQPEVQAAVPQVLDVIQLAMEQWRRGTKLWLISMDRRGDGFQPGPVSVEPLESGKCGPDAMGQRLNATNRFYFPEEHYAETTAQYTPRLPTGKTTPASKTHKAKKLRDFKAIPVAFEIDLCGDFESLRVARAVWTVDHSDESWTLNGYGDVLTDGAFVSIKMKNNAGERTRGLEVLMQDLSLEAQRPDGSTKVLDLISPYAQHDWPLDSVMADGAADGFCERGEGRRFLGSGNLSYEQFDRGSGASEEPKRLPNFKRVIVPKSNNRVIIEGLPAAIQADLCGGAQAYWTDGVIWTNPKVERALRIDPDWKPRKLTKREAVLVEALLPGAKLRKGNQSSLRVTFAKWNGERFRRLEMEAFREVAGTLNSDPEKDVWRTYEVSAHLDWPIAATRATCSSVEDCTINLGDTQ